MARLRSLLSPSPFKIGCLVILAAVAFFYSFGIQKPRLLEALDQRVVDTMFHWRGAIPAGERVVIVDLDEHSLHQVGQWPWPRHLVAQMLANIGAGGAAAIGLDMVFAEPDRTSPATMLLGSSLDQVLGETLAELPSVLGYVFERRDDGLKDPFQTPFPAARIQLVPPELSFADLQLIGAYRPILNVPEVSLALSEGFFNVFPDIDGTVRRVPLLMIMDGIPYPSLALELARLGLGEETLTIHAEELVYGERRHALLGVSVGPRYIPTDEQGQLTANFRGPPFTFTYVSAVDALRGQDLEIFQDKIVIIGTSAAGLSDLRATPFSEVFPGAEVHATVVDNILAGDPLVHDIYTEIGLTHATVIGGGLLLTFLLVYSGPLAGGLAALGLIIAAVMGNYFYFFLQNQVVGLVYPLSTLVLLFMVVTLSNYFFEGRQKRYLSKAFSQYVPPELVKEVAARPHDLALGGESREMTVLFSDVRGFTAISENLEAAELSQLMNEMLTPLTQVIHQHRGTIDKYMGDAIMAFWGAPLPDEDHARHGLQAALAMAAAMPGIREKFKARGWPAIYIGVGLNSGPMNVGNMGSEFRMAYTVMGDAVNLGARLEGLTKLYGAEIIISRATRDLVPDYACRELDLVRVSGKARPVAIFEPLGPAANLDQATTNELNRYHQALNLYRSCRFAEAAQLFAELHQTNPTRQLYRLYLDRSHQCQKHPPPPTWDQTFNCTTK